MTVTRLASVAWFVELLLPSRCVCCGSPGAQLCTGCRSSLRPIGVPRCGRCGAPTAWPVERCRECAGRRLAFSNAVAACAYDGPARPFVRAWKERGLRRLAPLAAELVVARLARPAADVITYIPSDPVRQLGRSTHPAESLARELGERWQLDVAGLLRRARTAERQASLPRARRGANVRGSFSPLGDAPRRVVLVDDIYTTGATVSAAASALRARGATRVDVITFARAVR